MPLFALLALTESDDNISYILSGEYKVEKMKQSNLMKDYINEIAKTNNIDIPTTDEHKYKKDKFNVYCMRLDYPEVSFCAFTNGGYSKKMAFECLNKYKELFTNGFDLEKLYGINRDHHFEVEGGKSLLNHYYDGVGKIKYDHILSKTKENYERTKEVRNETDQLNMITSQMDEDVNDLNRQMEKNNQCIKCNVF